MANLLNVVFRDFFTFDGGFFFRKFKEFSFSESVNVFSKVTDDSVFFVSYSAPV